ncbi:phosphate starvation protein PhoH [Advenella faeciporci]|uniref:Phosphate starvation protein PhoH n=1 Tax=Advenella faeciporci TaxID=797535 RepID=A0A918JIW8_9BURK|nr:PhoH family protein [Advenella faeciporci]GGW79553.1 phosphate starvation protein PhoH [Advenella faeciporci]
MPLPKLPTKPADTIDIGSIATPKTRTAATAARARPKANVADMPAAATAVAADMAQPAKTTRPTATKAASKTAAKSVAVKQPSPTATKTAAVKTTPTPKKTAVKTATTAATETKKLFVLDTNVLLHDPSSLFRFQEHDIFLPMMTLEELDHHKKGMTEVARNARQVSRSLDALAAETTDILHGMSLNALGNKDATGLLLFQTSNMESDLGISLPTGKADNMILSVVQTLQKQQPKRQVILVSKDINMRLKARALGMEAEDYLNDHSLEDSDLLYDGIMQLPANFWSRHGKDVESWMQGGITYYKIKGPLCPEFIINEFVYLEGDTPLYAQVKEVSGKTAVLATLRDYTHKKNNVWGVTARNREQNFALNLLMNPDCDFVSLLGQAGTGKTLLALASGLTQVLETKRYSEIIMTRVTVPVGEDIGFLPGTEEEKMQPWMGALEDNLEFLNSGIHSEAGDWDRSASKEVIKSHIKVKSLNFMRGRTFLNKFLIIDEAQNLTPKQMKTLITRAGPGTKIVCLGNIAQIDTPYLTEGSSGLTYVVDRFKGWSHSGHITLQKGERSRLADYASDAL